MQLVFPIRFVERRGRVATHRVLRNTQREGVSEAAQIAVGCGRYRGGVAQHQTHHKAYL